MRPPAWLTPTGKRYWKRFEPVVQPTAINGDILAIFCDMLSLYREASKDLHKNSFQIPSSTGGTKANNAWGVAAQACNQIRQLGKTLGIDDVNQSPDDDDELDEFTED